MFDGSTAARRDSTSMDVDNDFAPFREDREKLSADWIGEGRHLSFRIPLGSTEVKIEVQNHEPPEWLVNVIQNLNGIARLRADWDSYGAQPVKQPALEHALSVIIELMSNGGPPPLVGPTVQGGVSFEWHVGGKDLEVQVTGPFRVHAYFYDQRYPEDEWEDDVGVNLAPIKSRLFQLRG